MDPTPRGKEATALEQAVSRAMRDNLALVQYTAKELTQAIEDFVAACSSTRNANMLPAMLRAQTASASLASMLDVLSRLLTSSLQPARAGASESYVATLAAAEAPAAPPEVVAPPREPVPSAPPPVVPQAAAPVAIPVEELPPPPPPPPPAPAPVAIPVEAPPLPPPLAPSAPPVMRTGTVLIPAEPAVAAAAVAAPAAPAEPHILEHGIPLEAPPAPTPPSVYEPAPVAVEAAPPTAIEAPAAEVAPPEAPAPAPTPAPVAAPAAPAPAFRVEDLPAEQQELHRRANRHAKVSMQDIYLLRPKDVQLGRQNRDICARLKTDIEKARKEYVRRFGPILEHPVDYFHHWMVEVLAEGKPEVLGEYPYPSAAPRH